MLNQKNSSCQFADEIVSYLYGEIEAKEKLKFEAHLNQCSGCKSEFEGFQLTRTSILEWRDEEFSTLPQPGFEVISSANFSPANKNKSGSWFVGLRNLFSYRPAYAMALAIAVVGIGIVFYAIKFNTNDETADLQNNKIIERPVVSPTVEVPQTPPQKTLAADKTAEQKLPPVSETAGSIKETKPDKQSVPTKASVKIPSAKNNPDNQPLVSKEPVDKKTLPARKRQVPNLNQSEEDEDDSIRLADLFAELDTK